MTPLSLGQGRTGAACNADMRIRIFRPSAERARSGRWCIRSSSILLVLSLLIIIVLPRESMNDVKAVVNEKAVINVVSGEHPGSFKSDLSTVPVYKGPVTNNFQVLSHAERLNTFFEQGHPCSSATGPTEIPVGVAARIDPVHHGTEFYLTIVTLVAGFVKPNAIHEWIAWHIEAGADHFVIYAWEMKPGQASQLDAILRSFRPLCKGIEIIETKRASQEPLDEVWDVNIPRVIEAQRTHFAEAVIIYRDRSAWMAFIDIDEYISPSTDATPNPGQSFPQWLNSLPDEIDYVYMKWAFFPMPAETPPRSPPVTFSNFFRVSNVKFTKVTTSIGRSTPSLLSILKSCLAVPTDLACDPPPLHTYPHHQYHDERVAETDQGRSGKAVIKPKFFTGQ